MNFFLNFFPDEDRFWPLFRRLLRPIACVTVPFCALMAVGSLFSHEVWASVENLTNGTAQCCLILLFAPFLTLMMAMGGTLNLYFGRRIPIIRWLLPRVPDKKP